MTAQQINSILFWTTLGIVGFSLWLMYAANKFGKQLAKQDKAKKSASARGRSAFGGKSVKTKKSKRKEAK